MKITSSNDITPSHLKLMFWGESGSRKTESILRYFPNVLIIDTEGNAEQCAGMPDIPEFLLVQTKNPDEVIEVIDNVAAGKIKFKDGRPVLTVAVDSATVLWNVRKDTRALVVEKRIAKWGKSTEEASMTQLDWSMAKRPLLRLNTRLANCPIKYVIFTGRLADKYQEGAREGDMKKVGERPDVVKGLDYDINLVIRMNKADATKGVAWSCQIEKTQGGIGAILPTGKTLTTFPIDEILKYTSGFKPQARTDDGEDEVAEKAADREAASEVASETAPRRATTKPQASQPTATSATTATVAPEPGQTRPSAALTPEQIKAQVGVMLKEIGASGDDVRRVLGTTGVMEWLDAEGHTIDKLKSLVLDGMVSTTTN